MGRAARPALSAAGAAAGPEPMAWRPRPVQRPLIFLTCSTHQHAPLLSPFFCCLLPARSSCCSVLRPVSAHAILLSWALIISHCTIHAVQQLLLCKPLPPLPSLLQHDCTNRGAEAWPATGPLSAMRPAASCMRLVLLATSRPIVCCPAETAVFCLPRLRLPYSAPTGLPTRAAGVLKGLGTTLLSHREQRSGMDPNAAAMAAVPAEQQQQLLQEIEKMQVRDR